MLFEYTPQRGGSEGMNYKIYRQLSKLGVVFLFGEYLIMGLFNQKKSVGDRKNKERRRYVRISDSLRISYRLAADALRTNCRSTDISEGGIRFSLYEKLEIGDTLKLEIQLKDSVEPLYAVGRIAWTASEASDKEYPFEATDNQHKRRQNHSHPQYFPKEVKSLVGIRLQNLPRHKKVCQTSA